MGDKIRVMYSEEEVDKRIRELGEQISKRYEGKTVHMICVLKGGENYRSSNYGFYVRIKLWCWYKVKRYRKDCQGSGSVY